MAIYAELDDTIWERALSGDLLLEVNWTKWSSMFTFNTDESNLWVQLGKFPFMQQHLRAGSVPLLGAF